MTDKSNIEITITFTDTELNNEDKNEEAQNLLNQLQKLDEVEDVSKVTDPHPPDGNKAGGGFLPGILTTQVNPGNVFKLFKILKDKLTNKPIKFAVKTPDGREIIIEANNKEELDLLIQKAQDFINNK